MSKLSFSPELSGCNTVWLMNLSIASTDLGHLVAQETPEGSGLSHLFLLPGLAHSGFFSVSQE